jgi:hypothetical protein
MLDEAGLPIALVRTRQYAAKYGNEVRRGGGEDEPLR